MVLFVKHFMLNVLPMLRSLEIAGQSRLGQRPTSAGQAAHFFCHPLGQRLACAFSMSSIISVTFLQFGLPMRGSGLAFNPLQTRNVMKVLGWDP